MTFGIRPNQPNRTSIILPSLRPANPEAQAAVMRIMNRVLFPRGDHALSPPSRSVILVRVPPASHPASSRESERPLEERPRGREAAEEPSEESSRSSERPGREEAARRTTTEPSRSPTQPTPSGRGMPATGGFGADMKTFLMQQAKFSEQMQHLSTVFAHALPQGMTSRGDIFQHFAVLGYCLNDLKEQLADLEPSALRTPNGASNKSPQLEGLLKDIKELTEALKQAVKSQKEAGAEASASKQTLLTTLVALNKKVLMLQQEINDLAGKSPPKEEAQGKTTTAPAISATPKEIEEAKQGVLSPGVLSEEAAESASALAAEKGSQPASAKPQEASNLAQAARGGSETPASAKETAPPVLVRNPAELGAKIQLYHQKAATLPLTFIVPYPFPPKGEGIRAKGAKKGEMQPDEEGDEEAEGGGSGVERKQVMVFVPSGLVIVGDPFKEGRQDEWPTQPIDIPDFLIAATPVTNLQFARWLNSLFKSGQLTLSPRGEIKDQNGKILAFTLERVSTSQIQVQVSQGQVRFQPLAGTEYHPVVHVNYYGAEAFCQSNGVRLPSEAEWEKAAGMAVPEEDKLPQKFRYGFGSNDIDISCANYTESLSTIQQNLTLPAGFYNGTTVFSRMSKTIQTKNAISSYGCYDMSGNARQWTSSWYEKEQKQKVVKGGSYASKPVDLRVAARTPLFPDAIDAFTTFRVALDV